VINGSDVTVKRKEIDRLFIKVGRIQGIVVFLVITGYIFFGKQFISLWVGSEYAESYYVGLLLMIPESVPLTQNIGIEVQRAYNKQKARTFAYAGIAILNVILSIPLAVRFGAVGCAIGTCIALVLGNIIFMNWYYYKRLDIDIISFWREQFRLIPALIAPCIAGIAAKLFFDFDGFLELGAAILAYVGIYVCSMWLTGFNQSEKALIIGLLHKIRSRFRGVV
jgi:O-antigen/teichoic acid export membrane protein